MRLKNYLNEDQYYHITTKDNLKSIMKNGLKPYDNYLGIIKKPSFESPLFKNLIKQIKSETGNNPVLIKISGIKLKLKQDDESGYTQYPKGWVMYTNQSIEPKHLQFQ